MTQEQQIRNPNVILYTFHLREDFDEGFDNKGFQKVAKNAHKLWENLAYLGEQFDIKELKSLRDNLLCYKNGEYNPAGENTQLSYQELIKPDGKTLRFQAITQPDNLNLGGSIYPLRIHDTYAVDLTLSYKRITEKEKSEGITVKVADLSKFNPQGCLLPDKIQSSVGQTLLLYGEPVNVLDKDYSIFADTCVKAFVQDKVQATPKLINEGRLFGSPIFEYDNGELNPAKRCHILVWLKRFPETSLKLAKTDFNYYLLYLLCYRSKILFAYYKAREGHREAQILASNLEKEIPSFNKIEDEPQPEDRLKQLKDLLARIRTNLFNYTQCLRNLRECHNTVTTNTDNYAESLDKIRELSIEADNLAFLQNFLDLSKNKFQAQIQVDLNYLIPSQDLFKEMIDTIRGMVEILAEEQAQVREQQDKERDRNLQTTIAVVGVGIGFTGLAAASFPYLIPPDPKTPPIPLQPPFTSGSLHPFIWVLLLSLVFGFLGAGVAKGVTMLISSRSDKRAKLKSSTKNQLLNQANTPEVGQVTGVQQKVEIPTQPPRQ